MSRLGFALVVGLVLFMQASHAAQLSSFAARLEQTKLQRIEHALGQKSDLGLFAVVSGLGAGDQVRIRLASIMTPSNERLRVFSNKNSQAVFDDLAGGEYQVDVRWVTAEGEVFERQTAFAVTQGWNELEVRLHERSILPPKLALLLWQRATTKRGSWQRVAAWVPRLIGSDIAYAKVASDLPSMRWATEQCGSPVSASGQHFVLSEVMHVLAQWPSEALSPDGYAVLSQCLLSAGLFRTAVPIIVEWAAHDPDHAELEATLGLAARGLTRFEHWESMLALGEAVSNSVEARFYAALAALSLGRNVQAQSQLKTLYFEQRALDAARYQPADPLILKAGYNLALTYLAQGQDEAAMTVLDDIGRQPATQDATQHVLDLANLKLGWMLLKREQAASAKPVFRRMSLDGPYSRMALLGLGWSSLLPQGEPFKRVELETPVGPVPNLNATAPAIAIARWRAGEISCSSLRAVTQRDDLCVPTKSLERASNARATVEQIQHQVLAVWAALKMRQVDDLIDIELLLGLADLTSQMDRHEQSLMLLDQAESAIKHLSSMLDRAIELSREREASLWQQALPALQMWQRSRQGYGFDALLLELDALSADGFEQAQQTLELQRLYTQVHVAHFQAVQLDLERERRALQRYELDLRLKLAQRLDGLIDR